MTINELKELTFDEAVERLSAEKTQITRNIPRIILLNTFTIFLVLALSIQLTPHFAVIMISKSAEAFSASFPISIGI